MLKLKIAHITHPVIDKNDNVLTMLQPITFESMRQAQKEAKKNKIIVELYTATYREDQHIVPSYFKSTKPFGRSAYDLKNFSEKRKRPLIKDVLDRLYETSDADFFVYSNSDTAVVPEFYSLLKQYILMGMDSVAIKHRIIDKKYTRVAQLSEMYKEQGKLHPGFDCFMFNRDIYPKFYLGASCVRSNWLERVLLSNVITFSKSFDFIKDEYMTFCNELAEQSREVVFNAFTQHNETELLKILMKLIHEPRARTHKLINDFLSFHNKNYSDVVFLKDAGSEGSPAYILKQAPAKTYPNEFRHSNSWEHFRTQWLRQDPVYVIGQEQLHVNFVSSLIPDKFVFQLPELHYFDYIKKKFDVESDKIAPKTIESAITAIRKVIPLSTNGEDYLRKIVLNLGVSPKMLMEFLIIDNMLAYLPEKEISETRWLEKTAVNSQSLEIITRFYPRAKIIYVLNNPGKSILALKEAGVVDFSEESNKRRFDAVISDWMYSLNEMEKFRKKFRKHFYVLRIEELKDNPMKTAKEIASFIQIPFEKEEIRINKNFLNRISSYKSYELSINEKINLYTKTKGRIKQYGYGSLFSELQVNIKHHLLGK